MGKRESGSKFSMPLVLFLISVHIAGTRSQLTPDEIANQRKAIRNSKMLLYGSSDTVVPSSDIGIFNYVAARQEQSLNRAESIEQLHDVFTQSALSSSSSSSSSSFANTRRFQQQQGIDAEYSFARVAILAKKSPPPPRRRKPPPPQRGPPPSPPPPAFEAPVGCVMQAGIKLTGEDLPNGYNPATRKWTRCCRLCFERSDCFAWTLIGTGQGRGCHLKSEKDARYRAIGNFDDFSGSFNGVYERPPSPATPQPPSPPPPRPRKSPPPPKNTKSPPPPPKNTKSPPPPPKNNKSPPPPPKNIKSPPPPRRRPPPPKKAKSPPPPKKLKSPPPPKAPSPPPPLATFANRQTYGEVLGLSWRFYEAQRSGPTPDFNRIQWRKDSHVHDVVPGGWYDGGGYLKLNFPLGATVSMLAWGMIEFNGAYVDAHRLLGAKNNLHIAADYLHRCWDPVKKNYVGQIGDPNIEFEYWGRPEQEQTKRPALVFNQSTAAADLFGGVAAALAASSIAYKGTHKAWSDDILRTAVSLYDLGVETGGTYSNYYRKQTAIIYPSLDYQDAMAWAAGWLYRATKDKKYLRVALEHWNSGVPDIFSGWDSQWARHAVNMVQLAEKGISVPGIDTYREFAKDVFLKGWMDADGSAKIIKTPLGMAYITWNEFSNLAFSTEAAALALLHAKYEQDAQSKSLQIAFARGQINYALGFGSLRSYVVGFGRNPPLQPHHAAASCPDLPASCGDDQYSSKAPNPQVLVGALVAGPAGRRTNPNDPDDSYHDKRSDFVTNEVGCDYNAGFTTALAGLYALI